MRKLIFAIVAFGLVQLNMANAQTNRPVQRKKAQTTTVKKTPPVKPSNKATAEDPEIKKLMHKIDSLEALRDDLLARKEFKILESKTAKDGTEYQFYAVRGYDDGGGRLYIRIRNMKNDVDKFLKIKLLYENGDSFQNTGGWRIRANKGHWTRSSCGISINGNPVPELIKSLEITYQDGIWGKFNENDKLNFNNLKIEYDD